MRNDFSRATVEVRNTTRGRIPNVPLANIARAILSERYVLSVVVCGDKLSRRMNRTYRKKDYAPNVLSFPLGDYDGEIFLNVRKAEREARVIGIRARERIALLFVHGCLHLKGYEHGVKMERLERTILKKFGL